LQATNPLSVLTQSLVNLHLQKAYKIFHVCQPATSVYCRHEPFILASAGCLTMSEPPQLFGRPPGESPQQQEAANDAAELPLKRRGRPPGRPNTNIVETNFESNPHVQLWNSSKVDHSIPAVAINIRQAIPESVLTHDTQRAIYRLPSREYIYFVQGWINARQIASQRPSYINGLLIHSRGEDSAVSCLQCIERRTKNALGPFLTCRTLPGTFHNSCSNCKWFDNASACSLFTGPKPNRKRKQKDGEDLSGNHGIDQVHRLDAK
jgi:hypothetical protein